MQAQISPGQDEERVKADLEQLLQIGWRLDKDQIQLEKTYHLQRYGKVRVSDELHNQGQANIF